MRRISRVLAGMLVAACACAVPAHARDDAIASFDGTRIALHFFPAPGGGPAPTVMVGPGWSLPGETNENGPDGPAFGSTGVGTLRAAGYNVLTWDPRGFGTSGGTAEVDSPEFEGRDAQALIDYVAAQPEAQLDAAGDPRLGMSGASYGGAIQLVTAVLDPRVDAIVPVIAWHSLTTSLAKDRTAKTGWSNLLDLLAGTHPVDSHVDAALQAARAGKPVSSESERWFAARGPGDLVARIRAPTLLVQGTVDTLFTLQEAIDNYALLRRADVPVKMLWFCGGHGTCLTRAGDPSRTARATVAWLDRWLKGDASIDTGPRFEWVDQDGKTRTSADYPLAPAGLLTADGAGRLALVAKGGSGPAKALNGADILAVAAASVAAAKASNAVNVKIATPAGGRVVAGAPTVKLTYTGRARATRVLAQIVDDATGRVLGNQITPIPVKLDGRRHTVSRPLEVVALTTHARSSLTLQIVAQSTAYDVHPAGGAVTFSKVHVEVPVSAARR